MRFRAAAALCLIMLSTLACNLSGGGQPTAIPIATANSASGNKPTVVIDSPANGTEVNVGARIIVNARAADAIGVQRMQLLANGQIVKTVSSQSATGDQQMSAQLDYLPTAAGQIQLQVLAYRGAIASDPAAITLTVRSLAPSPSPTSIPAQSGGNTGGNSGPVINPNDPTCRALTNAGLNMRSGPGTNYDRITTLAGGVVVPIVGRIGDNSWWQVRSGNLYGWVNAPFTTVYGICSGVPIVQPPAPPTVPAAPTQTPRPTQTSVPIPTQAPLGADLVVTQFSGPQTLSLPDGQAQVSATFGVTITNVGGSSTGQFDNLILRTQDGAEIPVGSVGALGPGQSILLEVVLNFTQRGTFLLQARADSSNRVQEISEVNNTGTLNVIITS